MSKQISKIFTFLAQIPNKKLSFYGKRVVLAILLAVLVFPWMTPSTALAASFGISNQGEFYVGDGVGGRCPIERMAAKGKFEISKPYATSPRDYNYLGLEDEIKIYMEFEPISTSGDSSILDLVKANCDKKATEKKLTARLLVFNDGVFSNTETNFFYYLKSKGGGKVAVNFPAFKLSQLKEKVSANETISFYVYATEDGGSQRKMETANGTIAFTPTYKTKAGTTPGVDQITEDSYTDKVNAPTDDGSTKKLSDLGISIVKNESGAGLRDKYRVLRNEKDAYKSIVFGQNGVDPIYLKWTSANSGLVIDQYFTLPQKDDYTGPGDLTPWFKGVKVGMYKPVTDSKNFSGCVPGNEQYDCEKMVFNAPEGQPYPADPDTGTASITEPQAFNPVLNSAAWQTEEIMKAVAAGEGKPLGSVKVSVLPIILGKNSVFGSYLWVSFNSPQVNTTIEVYDKEEDLIAACNNDNLGEAICGSETGRRYQVGKVLEAATTTNEEGELSAAGDLFNFLRKVIAYVVLLITSFVYYVFSAILVPVIVALIKIRPYQDSFVNFIYPGWVILRNVANIFFIIALLWVGLRTLFQLDDSSKSRGFIVRLILAALLVNFSLVIGQAIVGIADTVQAQFLPGNTKVVETLGFKLMVDPIQTFRGVSGSGPDNLKIGDDADFTTDALASDLPKAIILLVLAVAAFFAFVALAAFLAVRIVALWILYMLSPLAYVGRILPQTQKYADEWWSQFLKYSFAVPIMAFFLNLTALLAVTVSPSTGQSVETGSSGTTILGGLIPVGDMAAGFASYAATVISHFVVLIFLFMGMKFALSFGGAGAKQIVGAAQKGFNKAFEYPWRGAKGLGRFARDTAAEQALESKYVKDRPKLASLISSAAQPTAAAKSLRDKLFTQPRKKQQENIAKGRGSMEDFAGKVGMNKMLAAKMLGWKMAGNNAKAIQARQAMLGNVMTDQERAQKGEKIGENEMRLGDINAGLSNSSNEFVTKGQALLYRDELQKDLKKLDEQEAKDLKTLEQQRAEAYAKNKPGRAAELEKEIDKIKSAAQSKRGTMQRLTDDIDARLGNLAPDAPDGAAVHMGDAGSAQRVLQINADVVKAEIKDMQAELDGDAAIRKQKGIEKWDDDDRAKVEKGMSDIIKSRQFPSKDADRTARTAKENEEIKKYDGIDDVDSQIAVFNTALSKNNTELATAIAKKMAKEGNFKDLLSAQGYKNNLDEFKKFMADKFKGTTVVVRNQIANELSTLNMANGNRALGNATSVDSKGAINWNSISNQQGKLAQSAGKKKLWEKKPDEMFYEDSATGDKKFIAGEEAEIHKVANNDEAHKRMKNTMSSKTAAEILKMHESGKMEKPLAQRTVDTLKIVAGKS